MNHFSNLVCANDPQIWNLIYKTALRKSFIQNSGPSRSETHVFKICT